MLDIILNIDVATELIIQGSTIICHYMKQPLKIKNKKKKQTQETKPNLCSETYKTNSTKGNKEN